MIMPSKKFLLRWVVVVAAMAAFVTGSACEARAASLDVLIKNGRVVDGTGAPWYVADVGIADGKIVRIGHINPESARRVIDATGLVVAPGFIDLMGQSATPMLRDPASAVNLLAQGITTINAGEGASAAPLDTGDGPSAGWTTMAEYFQLLALKGLPVNVVQTVGHTQVRRVVMGDVDRRPSDEEFEQMGQLVREAMEAGAIGLSTALIYPPAVYAQTEEIVRLAQVAGEYGGRYYTHMRNEGDQLLEAIDEALYIGRQAKTPVHIFHLKAAGRQNRGKMQLAIAKINAARADGQQVTADIYPYVHNGLGIESFIHPRHFADGRDKLMRRLGNADLQAEIRDEMETTSGWENWYRHIGNDWNHVIIGQASDKRYADLAGRSLAAMAEARDEDPWETFFNLARTGAFALPESMTDANKILAMQQPFIGFCTDVGPVRSGDGLAGGARSSYHPRAFGSFPRLLSHYVHRLGTISLERAIAQASAVAANDIFAYDRGRIAEGLAADVVVFDFEGVDDRATFAEPHTLAQGMQHVLVNGVVVFRDGKFTGKRPGKVLKGPGFRPAVAPHVVHTGEIGEGLRRIDRAVRNFMREHAVPGAAVAVTDQGRLVFARGYGYADIAAKQQVTPNSLFRIASISKPITAVAVLQLAEEGKLHLEDRVWDILKYEPHLTEGQEPDSRMASITVKQLLQHRAGWDRDASFDPMFQSVRFAETLGVAPPAKPEHVIRCMLGCSLDFDPGQRYAYSNYGYCLLGRIVEVVSGQDYESYVKEHVFAPIGVRSARVGKTRFGGRHLPHEVRYYDPARQASVFDEDLGQRVPSAYGGWYLEAMDSHGGWIASAVDLVRLAAALDNPADCPLLSAESITTMFAPPTENGDNPDKQQSYYSCGWSNRGVAGTEKLDNSHSGSLPGTATLLVRRHDGRNVAVLFNARSSPKASHFGRAVHDRISRAIDSIEHWPDTDLFHQYE